MHRSPAAFAALAAVTLIATACGDDSSGKAAATSTGKAALFDPCTTIPAAAITQIGAKPESADPNTQLNLGPDWKTCAWHGPWYTLNVFATTRTIDETRGISLVRDFRQVSLPGRDAHTYTQTDYPAGTECNVTYPFAGGSVQIEIAGFADEKDSFPEQPCDAVLRAAGVMDAFIPH
jgi:hypothetical protein